jgi:hypothetical protein
VTLVKSVGLHINHGFARTAQPSHTALARRGSSFLTCFYAVAWNGSRAKPCSGQAVTELPGEIRADLWSSRP